MSAVDCRVCDDAEGWRALPGLGRIVDDLAEQIPELLARHHVPGLAIGVCDRSGVLWAKGFGATRAEGGRPVTPSTMFSIQSCSKMYTAAVVMLAVERGLVGLDRPITAYLPEFTVNSCFEGPAQDKITLRHLLGHTAGFTHEAPEGSNFLIGAGSFPAHCRSISDTWLRFPVGHHCEYSNLGIDLAGWAVARLAGAAFPEVARRWLFAPLGLSRTTFAQRVITQEDHRAVGHDRRYKRVPLRIPMVPSGGAYTSVEDACRFVQLHLDAGKPVLSSASLAEMSRIPFPAPGQATGYGLGLAISMRDGRTVYGHNGGGFGFLADYCWDPVAGVGVVVLTNSVDHPLQGSLAASVLGDLAGPLTQTAPTVPGLTEVAVSAAQLQSLAGCYVGRGGRTAALLVRDGHLVLRSAERDERLHMTAEDEFFVETDPAQRFRLLPDQNGHTAYLQNTYSGFTYYCNDVERQSAEDVADTQEFLVSTSGVPLGPARLQHLRGGDAILEIPDEPPLLLHPLHDGRYISTTGEVLDLRQNPPTYANIQLHPRHPQRTAEVYGG